MAPSAISFTDISAKLGLGDLVDGGMEAEINEELFLPEQNAVSTTGETWSDSGISSVLKDILPYYERMCLFMNFPKY